MSLKGKYPALYECSICEATVKVIPQGEGIEPIIERSCSCPADTVVYAKRKVTLRGVGELNQVEETAIKIKVSVRQMLCWLTGRSI
jgi:hypothetical protein